MKYWIMACAVVAALSGGTVSIHATPVNLKEFVNFQDLRSYTGTAAHAIVDGRVTSGDGGGGEFYQNGTVGGGCSTTDDDDGVVLVGTGSPALCWYRQFWGPVHLAWYGAPDATQDIAGVIPATKCYENEGDFQSCAADNVLRTDSSAHINAVANAFAAAANKTKLPGADGGVTTDGRSIVMYTNDLAISPTQYFTCNAPPGGLREQQAQTLADSEPYYLLPSSIVLNTGTADAPTGYTISVQEQAAFYNCIVRPTWYNPTIFDPSTNPIGSTRDIVDRIEHKLAGTCITAGGESIRIHDDNRWTDRRNDHFGVDASSRCRAILDPGDIQDLSRHRPHLRQLLPLSQWS